MTAPDADPTPEETLAVDPTSTLRCPREPLTLPATAPTPEHREVLARRRAAFDELRALLDSDALDD